MEKANLKPKTILWTIAASIALIVIILCSVIIAKTSSIEVMEKSVRLDFAFVELYRSYKAYAIGILAFAIVVFLMGAYIAYAGFKSWNYNATL
ncbi:hypothetical protein ACJA25_02005 [Mycoplasmopsis hyopharyngis]|uniref:hypothetical protein n=1 Tax=Mycoplasmopsis hyopharyngis TaxID=29558 RepID=UPI003872D4DD